LAYALARSQGASRGAVRRPDRGCA
jgi:hypothetical protein